VLLAASSPAATIDVAVPGQSGNVTGGQGQAGTIGGLAPGANGGVSVVPSLGLGLTPALTAGAGPAPLARPAAAVQPEGKVYGGIKEADLNPPKGWMFHDPAKPVAWPARLQAEAAAARAKAPKKPLWEKPPAPPAIDRPAKLAASAGDIDAALLNAPEAAAAAEPDAADSDARLKELYDGSLKNAKAFDDDLHGMTKVGMYAAQGHPSTLAPAAPFGKKASAALEPPAPKGGPVSNWIGGKLDKASETWSKVKSKFAKTKVEALAQAASPEAAAEPAPAESAIAAPAAPSSEVIKPGETIVVRTSRGTSHSALGYRILYAAPEAEGLEVTSSRDEALSVRVERGDDHETTRILRERFAVFNGLIESNFAALELMAQSSSKMTVKTARAMHAHVADMAAAFVLLSVNGPRQKDAFAASIEVQKMGVELEEAFKALSDSDLLPPEAVKIVMPIEYRSLHSYLNYLHQAALEVVGKVGDQSPTNLTVRIGSGEAEKAVSLVDLSENPLFKGSRIVSTGFKALVAAMSRSKDTPTGSLIMQDHQFWGHFKLGAHSAEIYANFLQPDEGGMIRVRYQEWGTGYDNQTRLYYVGRLLHKAGFHVDQKNGFLTAVVDKDHASQTSDEMTETFALIVQALHATVGVDFALPMLVRGAKTSEEVGRRIDDWVDTVLGEGTLPFYVHDDQEAMVAGWLQYDAARRSRAKLRAALDRNLKELGLPAIPDSERLGQRTIDRFVNEPIEAAIARGQLRLDVGGKPARNERYDPLKSLAAAFDGGPIAGARMAEVVSSLDPALFKYETIGSLGALTVERAQRKLDPNAWITIYALRDPKNGQIGFARAEISALLPGEKPRSIAPTALFAALRAQGHPVAQFTPSELPPGFGYFQKLLSDSRPAREGLGRPFQGMAASPGHGRTLLARVTYDKAKAAAGGYIFVSPYTTPDDLDAIRGSKAVITTSGGLLSHAAITTREMGIPAVILPGVEWADGAASMSSFDLGEPVALGRLTGRPANPTKPFALREGEVVRLDPATGVVELFPEGASAALLDTEGALERFDATGSVDAFSKWLAHRLASKVLRADQREIAVREAVSGLFARAVTGVKAGDALIAALKLIPQSPLGSLGKDTVDALFAAELAAASAELAERSEIAAESLSTESVERLANEARSRARGLADLSRKLGRPAEELASYKAAYETFVAGAKERHGKLMAEEMAELQAHARQFPAATVEALPRMKSAIAKAKRRKMDPAMIQSWEEQAARLEKSRRVSMESAAPAVLSLTDILDVDVPWVGGKGAKLGEIAAVVKAAGGEVPPGIVLTINAYRRFLKESGIAERLEALGADTRLTIEERSERARRLILDAKLTGESGIGKEILAGLSAEDLAAIMLAVRSSAVDEDGAEAAFAGAGDTHLYVDQAELLEHVKEIWASLWNPRALLYREARGLSTRNMAQAVVVQAMVDSEVSGVAFTQDPVSGNSGRVIVNAAFGLGEGIVSSRVAPDQYVLAKTSGREILPAMVSDKKLAIVRGKNGKGTVEQKMPPEWRRRRSMTPAKLKLLSDVSTALERHFGYALDIEFGFVGDKLYILQARAVTSNGVEKKAPVPAVPAGSKMKPAAAIHSKQLMFVCTGNTCRSPMAEHLAREKLARSGRPDIGVVSRGLAVETPGQPMNAQAKKTLEGQGVFPEGHQAALVTKEDIKKSTLILTMTSGQAETLAARFPEAKGKVYSLAEYTKTGGDIDDPYGGSDVAYKAAATEIADALDVFAGMVAPQAASAAPKPSETSSAATK